MNRRFFIAHSSDEKDIALSLKDELHGEAWIDLHEIEVGDILLEEISSGIENASDFILLWSSSSAKSKWARFEFHMAFIRHLEDNAINLRVVCLDTTALPLFIRPFLQLRKDDPVEIALSLLGAPPHTPRLRKFVNRYDEIGAIEAAIYNPSIAAVWFWGIAGIGKRTLVDHGLSDIVSASDKVRRIEVRTGTGQRELDLAVSSALGQELPGEDDLLDGPELIEQFVAGGGIWVFHEVQHWLEDDAAPGSVLRSVLARLRATEGGLSGRLSVFSSTRKPDLQGWAKATIEVVKVSGLSPTFAVGLLQARGAEGTLDDLATAADQLHGHPLALEVASADLPKTSKQWEESRLRVASDLVAATPLKKETIRLLETLAAVDGPLPGAELASHLNLAVDSYHSAVSEAVSYSLLEVSGATLLRLHPLVKEFFLRSFSHREDRIGQISQLADRAVRYVSHLSDRSSQRLDATVTAVRLLLLSGRETEAFALRNDLNGVLFEAGVQLYRERDYRRARHYFQQVQANVEGMHVDARLFEARCQAYLDETAEAREMVDDLVKQFPNDPKILRVRGRIEYLAKEWEAAIGFYNRARVLRPSYKPILLDLGQAMVRAQDWVHARVVLEELVNSGFDSPFSLSLYSQVLEHFEEFAKADDFVRRAIRQDPSNAAYRHRLGRIAQLQENNEDAIERFKEALELDPKFIESALSLSSLYVDLGRLEEARKSVERAALIPGVPQSVLENVRAKIASHEGDIDAARMHILSALKRSREAQNLGLAAAIELQAIESGKQTCEDVADLIKGFALELRQRGQHHNADEILARLGNLC